MSGKVLYFPYIDIPQSAWLTRMLLYWDTVGVIMPYQFVEEPETLEDFTRDLLQAGLLAQVIPGQYVGDVPNFSKSFLAYLNSLGPEGRAPPQAFSSPTNRPQASRAARHSY